MLWKAIAIESVRPKVILWEVARKVVIPSGMLWSNRAVKDIKPTLYKSLFFVVWEIRKSILLDNKPPLRKNMVSNNIFEKGGYEESSVAASGISEAVDTINITPLENARDKLITMFW